MFLGEYIHNLDSKGRLTLPAKFREELAAGLVVTRSLTERCLLVMPMSEWTVLSEKVSALPYGDPNSAALRRFLFGNAEDLVPDKQGRILISQRLRDHAQIRDDVVILGVQTHVELWQPQDYQEKVVQKTSDLELSSQMFSSLGI